MFIQRAIHRYDEGITPAEIYSINQLQAMRLAEFAWREVDATTIRNCWCKAGILPDVDAPSSSARPSIPVYSLLSDPSSNSIDPIAHAERQVEIALNDLVQTGMLQGSNCMDIESLLNPAGESQVLMETSDHEIYQTVMDAIDACENIEINGGDDIDNDIPLEPRPTRRDVLKAISTIGRYVDDLNEPIARKMEAVLESFSRQLRLDETRTMKGSILTDFFPRL